MQHQIYFDINSPDSGGTLYREQDKDGHISFNYHHSTYDDYRDEIKVYQTVYPSFDAFWQHIIKNPEWFYQHPLYVHPDVRTFVQEQLKSVNWNVQGDKKWQESHQRQWKKVLTDPDSYYDSLKRK